MCRVGVEALVDAQVSLRRERRVGAVPVCSVCAPPGSGVSGVEFAEPDLKPPYSYRNKGSVTLQLFHRALAWVCRWATRRSSYTRLSGCLERRVAMYTPPLRSTGVAGTPVPALIERSRKQAKTIGRS